MTGEHERGGRPDRPSDDLADASDHPDVDRLSAWTAGALSADATAEHEIAVHVADCAECSQQVDALAEVSALLTAQPAPPMPADVFARLSDVVAMESASRIAVGSGHSRSGPDAPHPAAPPSPPSHGSEGERELPSSDGARGSGDPHPRPLLGSFADRPGTRRSKRSRLGRAVGGLVLAGVLGSAGYVLSASVGLNEPTAVNPVSVDPTALRSEAVTAEGQDLSPHRFSRAWRCARAVTEGSITGIRPVVVGGDPSYLVLTDDDGVTSATLVSGCAEGRPKAGTSVSIPKR